MEELKYITIEDTQMFLTDKKNSIYKAIIKNNITNVYDLFMHIDDVLNLLTNYENDKGEFLAIIKLLKYKYLNEELYFDYDFEETFSDCYKNRRSWNSIERKIQSFGIPNHVSYCYTGIIYCNKLHKEYRVIDILFDIYKNNKLNYESEKYKDKVYQVAKNRVELLLTYYLKKEKNNEQKLVRKIYKV